MAFATTKKKVAIQKQASQPLLDATESELHQEMTKSNVAELAYLKAESRGFIPGYELDDWLEAEQACDISSDKGKVGCRLSWPDNN
jgi:hypothetical protein